MKEKLKLLKYVLALTWKVISRDSLEITSHQQQNEENEDQDEERQQQDENMNNSNISQESSTSEEEVMRPLWDLRKFWACWYVQLSG